MSLMYKLRSDFYLGCKINVNESKTSSYYAVSYKGFVFKFCISDHHRGTRGNLLTIISKNRKKNHVKRIAWEHFFIRKIIS